MGKFFSVFLIFIMALPLCVGATGQVEMLPETPVYCREGTPIYYDMETEEEINAYSYLGEYQITAYCPCSYCCGKCDGITASGTYATEGRTVAVDTSVIPYGTELLIDGKTYIAEDCGGSIQGNRIDIFFNSHEEAVKFGVQSKEVYRKE